MLTKIFLVLLLACASQAQEKYVPPTALVEPLYPTGFRISIPNEPGIESNVYHIRINRDIVMLKAGTLVEDVSSPKRGYWVYHDKNTKLQKNDVIYYMVHVIYKGLGYNLVNQEYVVTDFYDYNGNKVQSTNGDNDSV